MPDHVLGVAAMGGDANDVCDTIAHFEEIGLRAAWLTTGGAGLDALTLLAASAVETDTILLGTAIVPTWPRHPVVTVQQAQAIAQLAPGRLRLGVGPSHETSMSRIFGVDYREPLSNLFEYIGVLRGLLHEGAVEFRGEHYTSTATIASPIPDVPIMASALRPKAYALCGAIADGAISWLCPPSYLEKVALPALQRGAQEANREAPPLIVHLPVCVHDDADEAAAAFRDTFARYLEMPNYARMQEVAGFPEALSGTWSAAMIDAMFASGTEERVAARLYEVFAMGVDEVIAQVVPAGPDHAESRERTLDLLARLTPLL